tara:strand:+ start:308 stop:628 length:321 start_codon:yes stop_codon:yes gene_type:complete
MDHIKIMKLVNGEFIVGKVTQNKEPNIEVVYTIRQPLQITMIEDSLALINYHNELSDDEGINIDRSNILYMSNANNALSEGYLERTSGIIRPNSSDNSVRLSNIAD